MMPSTDKNLVRFDKDTCKSVKILLNVFVSFEKLYIVWYIGKSRKNMKFTAQPMYTQKSRV
ncbi:hypothetical protein Plhal304r1_c029g0095541 [Plasmopara halstedii]